MGDDELGWRRRGIALAALGGAAMGRAAFAPRYPGAPGPLQMQVLVYLAAHGVSDPVPEEGGLAFALRIDQEIVTEYLACSLRRTF